MVRLPRAAANTNPVEPLCVCIIAGPRARLARRVHAAHVGDRGIGSDSMADRQFAISGKWALAADRLQWMVQRQYISKGELKWQPVSFVASTKDILACCLREKGCPPADAERLLAGLPATFEQWTKTRAAAFVQMPQQPNEPAPSRNAITPL